MNTSPIQILIVDDDHQLLSLMRDIFEIEGWIVRRASSISEAEQQIKNYDINCFVIDLKLPDGDGNELIEYLRSCQTAPILAISGEYKEHHAFNLAATSQIGADYYLSKPFEPDELIIECRRLIEKSNE